MRVIDDYQIDSENMRVPSRCQRSNSLLGFVDIDISLKLGYFVVRIIVTIGINCLQIFEK